MNEAELLPCPFCGSDAEIDVVLSQLSHEVYRERIPRDAVQIEMVENQRGGKIYQFRVPEYIPRCRDSSCCGRIYRRFPSRAHAVKKWNSRAKEESA